MHFQEMFEKTLREGHGDILFWNVYVGIQLWALGIQPQDFWVRVSLNPPKSSKPSSTMPH